MPSEKKEAKEALKEKQKQGMKYGGKASRNVVPTETVGIHVK
jgi:hypothetical protein